MKTLSCLFFLISSLSLRALDVNSLHEFWTHIDPVPVRITDLGPDRIGQYNAVACEIKIDEYRASETTLVHEYMHYMIHHKNIEMSREDEEYVCCMVEALYEFAQDSALIEKRLMNSETHRTAYFIRKMIPEYVHWLKSETLIDCYK